MIQKLVVCGRMVKTGKKGDRSSVFNDEVMTEMYPNTDEGDKLLE